MAADWNLASMRSMEKSGYQPVARVQYKRMLWRESVTLIRVRSGGPPGINRRESTRRS